MVVSNSDVGGQWSVVVAVDDGQWRFGMMAVWSEIVSLWWRSVVVVDDWGCDGGLSTVTSYSSSG